MSEILTDWTKPEAYMRPRQVTVRGLRVAGFLLLLAPHLRASAAERAELRAIAVLRAASRELPPYLRRDIGLPPYC